MDENKLQLLQMGEQPLMDTMAVTSGRIASDINSASAVTAVQTAAKAENDLNLQTTLCIYNISITDSVTEDFKNRMRNVLLFYK